ncbi:uncharacterized protein [Aegilops tauschii subsp. strangulata]|uniref:uncharacterized protein n=1 Tax=Aegilops tauschii subsp. strangulata TaxID=200361 RepID=UPI00098AB2B6|nr:SOSS complex subunit B homolog [Aegilops tauschii subsp. strangulata]
MSTSVSFPIARAGSSREREGVRIARDRSDRLRFRGERGGAREETCLSLVADETATVHFLLWGTECDAFEPGDIVRLTSGIFSYHRGNKLFLRAGKRGRTKKVGEFTMTFVETPNMSIEMRWGRWGPDPGDPRKMVQEAVLSPYSQVFKPLH